MRITGITALGLDRLADVELDLTHPRTGREADILLCTGPSGAGKTTLLEAVFAAREGGVHGAPLAPWTPQSRDNGAAKLLLTWALDDALRERFPGPRHRELEAIFNAKTPFPVDNDPAFEHALADESTAWGRWEYFHARRRGAPLAGFVGRATRSSRSLDKYAGTARFLAELVVADDPRRHVLNETLGVVGCATRLTGVAALAHGFAPELRDGRGASCGVDELPDGEHDALLILATALRFELGAAPIFIDVPELALGLERAARLLAALSDLTGAQLFCATQEPQAFAGLAGVVEIPCGGAR